MDSFRRPQLPAASAIPATPQEDPAIAALRKKSLDDAEKAKERETQEQLGLETVLRRRLSLRSLLGPLGGGALTSLLGKG